MNPEAILDRCFGSIVTYSYPYWRDLPEELARWHLHTVDGGHCLAVAARSKFEGSDDPSEILVPIPVRSVERIGYEIRNGYIVCDLEYHPELGVVGDFGQDLEFYGNQTE
ncbi:hypothetical protein ACQP2T_61875 [Nonomuraea sp. CA-143628]|uniref:hypothetical protein n=1 Tax=Nonomuraea sp. CA-143628 TaxID=3239997 RepID=UPI003D8D860C